MLGRLVFKHRSQPVKMHKQGVFAVLYFASSYSGIYPPPSLIVRWLRVCSPK